MNKLSGIVPIASWDFHRSKILFNSLNKFFDPDSFEIIYIIFPEPSKIKEYLNQIKFKIKVEVLTEEQLIPEKDYKIFKKKNGWYRQQIIKLMVSKSIKTDYYICLDADVICLKPTKYSQLVVNNKPNVNLESKKIHQKWWHDSKKLLKIKSTGSKIGMSSTTNILITEEVLNLIEYLENRYKKSFVSVLFNKYWFRLNYFRLKWTEYKLYWTFIEYRNKTNAYNSNDVVWGDSIWRTTETIDEKVFEKILSPQNKGYFTVCQSTRIDDETISRYVSKHLGLQV